MKHKLHWKRGALSTTYQIFEGEESLGQLQNSAFKQTSEGIINQKRFQFKTKGVFKQDTSIIDLDKQKEIGKITYNSWMSRATIQLGERTVYWKYDSSWQTKWSFFNDRGILMKFRGRLNKGSIEYEDNDDLLVLTGLFVTNYYQQAMIAIIVAVFIPIWVTLFN